MADRKRQQSIMNILKPGIPNPSFKFGPRFRFEFKLLYTFNDFVSPSVQRAARGEFAVSGVEFHIEIPELNPASRLSKPLKVKCKLKSKKQGSSGLQ